MKKLTGKEKQSLIVTTEIQSMRKFLIHFISGYGGPKFPHFSSSLKWQTLSKAVQKSKYTQATFSVLDLLSSSKYMLVIGS